MAVTRLGGSGFPRSLYGSFAGKVEAEIEETAQANTGGWNLRVFDSYRDDERKRRQRVAMGVIPETMPEADAEAVIAAADKRLATLAQAQIAKVDASESRIKAMQSALADLLDAQAEAEREWRARRINEITAARNAANLEIQQITQQQRNAEAVLLMLAEM